MRGLTLKTLSRLAMSIALITSITAVCGQSNYPPELPSARVETYKTVDDVSLQLWIFEPQDHDPKKNQRPAIVFFFGGGWRAGSPAQFEQQCRYFASRGVVAITADYRVASRHGVKANACVEDAKSAVRWIRQNATRLGIHPDQICAGGGSAGGHTSCCTALIDGFDASNEDLSVSSVPNALALFNPAVMIAPLEDVDSGITTERYADIASRTGVPPEQISPIHHVRKGLPPTIIFHGKADTTVPYATVEEFSRRMNAAGNRCELSGFAGAPHGFFNMSRGKNSEQRDRSDQWYRRTVFQLDQFLESLGWIEGPPSIRVVDQDFVSLRGNYVNSFHRFTDAKEGHVAFLGGSITEMEGYRPRAADWLQKRFPDTKFTFTNAGISSTCSTTGAFRLYRDVLSKGPVDLLFVEFAVNDDQDAAHSAIQCIQGMEGIIRHTRQHNPRADIVMTHFVNLGMLETLAAGEDILSATQHERVAIHYDVSSSFLSKEVAARIKDESLTWKQFGGVHPGPIGNQLAADQATSILDAAWKGLQQNAVPMPHSVPEKLLEKTAFTAGQLVSPEIAANDDWKFSEPNWDNIPGSKRRRFLGRSVLHTEQPEAVTAFDFEGTAAGAFVVAGPDAGRLEVKIDDEPWKTVELYHRFSKGLHYPRTVMFATDLPPGEHRVQLRVASEHHPDSKGTAVRIVGLAINNDS